MSAVISHCLLDAAGTVLAQANATQPFYAASTIKLTVMAAIARRIDRGAITWADELRARSTFDSAVPSAPAFIMAADDRDERMPPDGTPMTIRELVHAMITRSSNEATDLLVPLVGYPALAEVHTSADAFGCRMERLIGDTAARDAGLTNEVTPLGLARLMHAIVTGALASPQNTAVMVDTLRAQEYPCIAEDLPAGTAWGSKSGWAPGIEHDVAFVGEPGSAGMRVLAVCTGGFPDRDARPEIHRVTASSLAGHDVL